MLCVVDLVVIVILLNFFRLFSAAVIESVDAISKSAIVRDMRFKDGIPLGYDNLRLHITSMMENNNFKDDRLRRYNEAFAYEDDNIKYEETALSILFCDVWVDNFQFGHFVNGVTQLTSWILETRTTYDQAIIKDMAKAGLNDHSLYILSIGESIIGKNITFSKEWASGNIRVNRVTILLPNERNFISSRSHTAWQMAAAQKMQMLNKFSNLDYSRYEKDCSIPNQIVFLSREEKSRNLRLMLNVDVAVSKLQVFYLFGMCNSAYFGKFYLK